jgi:antitoxin FitA
MSAITIRNVAETLVSAIKRKAAEHGVSMEEEVRTLLAATYTDEAQRRGREWAERPLERLKRRAASRQNQLSRRHPRDAGRTRSAADGRDRGSQWT